MRTQHARFGVTGEGIGICYTRTGRRFFDEGATEREFLEKIHEALSRAGFWEEFQQVVLVSMPN